LGANFVPIEYWIICERNVATKAGKYIHSENQKPSNRHNWKAHKPIASKVVVYNLMAKKT